MPHSFSQREEDQHACMKCPTPSPPNVSCACLSNSDSGTDFLIAVVSGEETLVSNQPYTPGSALHLTLPVTGMDYTLTVFNQGFSEKGCTATQTFSLGIDPGCGKFA